MILTMDPLTTTELGGIALQAPSPGRERLAVLSRFLRTVPAERFDLGIWGETEFPARCDSAGCAVGWATTIPEFQAQGLSGFFGSGGSFSPRYDGPNGTKTDWEAVESFFGLHADDAWHLFYFDEYEGDANGQVKPAEVADRIDAFLANGAAGQGECE